MGVSISDCSYLMGGIFEAIDPAARLESVTSFFESFRGHWYWTLNRLAITIPFARVIATFGHYSLLWRSWYSTFSDGLTWTRFSLLAIWGKFCFISFRARS